MKVHDCRLMAGARWESQFPAPGPPEVAFLGRSNVGKSSLINTLVGRKLARVSRTPGRTQQAHFYSINGKAIFVDLPGYGYAKAPARVRKELARIIEGYLTAARPLTVAMLVVDARHEPTVLDLDMSERLAARGLPVQVVSTKIDKLSRREREMSLARCRRLMERTEIIEFSSDTGEGKRELWRAIEIRIAALKERKEASPRGEERV